MPANPSMVVRVSANLTDLVSGLGNTRVAVTSTAATMGTLSKATTSTSNVFSQFHTGLSTADKTLAMFGVHLGPQIQSLHELGVVAGKTATQLSLIDKASLILAAFLAGLKLGRLIAEFFDLDRAIGNVTAKLLGFGDAAGQAAAAQADVLAKASKTAGRSITSLSEAMAINTAASQHFVASLQTAEVRANLYSAQLDKVDDAFKAVTASQAVLILKGNAHHDSVMDIAKALNLEAGAVQAVLEKDQALQTSRQKAVAAATRLREEYEKVSHLATLQPFDLGIDPADIPIIEDFAIDVGLLGQSFDVAGESAIAFGGDLDRLARKAQAAERAIFKARSIEIPDLDRRDVGRGLEHGVGMDGSEGSTGPGFFKKGLTGIGEFFRKGLGDIGKGFLQGIGNGILGLVSGAATAGLTKLFNYFNHTEQKKVNEMREKFVQLKGGLGPLNEAAHQVGLTLDGMLHAKTVAQYTAEVERLQRALDLRIEGLGALSSAEDKYGFTAIANSEELMKNYRVLLAGGRDESDILRRMSGDWQTLIRNAVTFGTTLDVKLKDPIGKLIEMGQITLEDGSKLTDINQLTFGDVGEAGKSAMDVIRDAVDKLVAAIKLSLGMELSALEEQLLGIEHHINHLPQIPGGHTPGGGPPKDDDDTVPGSAFSGAMFGGSSFSGSAVSGASMAASSSGSGGDVVVHTPVYLDGQHLTTVVTRRQMQDVRLRRKGRAA